MSSHALRGVALLPLPHCASQKVFCLRSATAATPRAPCIRPPGGGRARPSRAGPARENPRSTKTKSTAIAVLLFWRRRRDLNSRAGISRPTPLAGAPLRPLEYFSVYPSAPRRLHPLRTLLLYTLFPPLSSLFFTFLHSFPLFWRSSLRHFFSFIK